MVRNYKSKTERTKISEENIEKAINEILKDKVSVREAASKYQLPKSTLFNRFKKMKHGTDNLSKIEYKFQSKYSSQQVFTAEQERMLSDYLVACSQLNYGLTYCKSRSFAFQYAYHLQLSFPEQWKESEMAGVDWMQSFMGRHPELSLRKPEKTSISRASAFNAENVKAFMDNYETVLKKYHFAPENIYNLDETGISTVMDPPKVISRCGQKQVAQASSTERGQLVTVCAIINAIGNTIPPVFVFPRHRYKEYFLKGSPQGSKGCATPSGWMNGDTFLETMKHFQKHTKSSKDNPVLLILDNHESHSTLDLIRYCRENGIVLLTFPPHTSHRLQPLDVAIFGPFKANVKAAFNDWMMNNPGKRVSIYDIPDLTTFAYNASFNIKNISSGFRSTGIWPFNRNIFDDNDFLASKVTKIDATSTKKIPSSPISLVTENVDVQEKVETLDNGPSTSLNEYNSSTIYPSLFPDQESASSGILPVTPESIRPYPKFIKKGIKRTGRKPGKTRILTSTPEKIRIENEVYQRNEKRKQALLRKEAVAAKKAKLYLEIDSDSEPEFSLGLGSDMDFSDNKSNDMDTYEKLRMFDPSMDEVKINDFILVRFFAEKSAGSKPIYYIGRIDSLVNKEVIVSFLRRKDKSWNFIFPDNEDVSAVDVINIILKLPPPTTGPGTSTRSYTTLKFCVDLQGYNVR